MPDSPLLEREEGSGRDDMGRAVPRSWTVTQDNLAGTRQPQDEMVERQGSALSTGNNCKMDAGGRGKNVCVSADATLPKECCCIQRFYKEDGA